MIITRSKESFRIALKNISAKGDYAIETQGTRQVIVKDKRRVLLLSNSNPATRANEESINVKQLFKTVKSSFTKYITAHNLSPEKIPGEYSSCFANKELWQTIPVNTELYHIDACHCYWRVANILGYISDNVYKKYVNNKDAKTLRNISLSRVTSKLKREYFSKGQKLYEVECDVSLHAMLYDNIRHYTYNNSGQIKDAIHEYCIAYRVDGVYLLPEGLKKAKSIFRKNGLLFKVTKGVKVDDKNYCNEDGEIKKIM